MNNTSNSYTFTFEIANNHMGDIEHGKALLSELKKVCLPYDYEFIVKFQFRDLDTFIHPEFKGNHDYKFVKRFEETTLSDGEWSEILNYSKSLGFSIMCTPFDENSVPRIVAMGFDKIKIASCSLTDWPLLDTVAETSLPVIASTAGSSVKQIDNVVTFFKNKGMDLTLMHCVGLYPTPFEQLNVSKIGFLADRYSGTRIGYSTHEDPKEKIPITLAIGQGATIFEKHVALETETYKKNEYSSSMEDLSSWLETANGSIIALNNVDHLSYRNETEIEVLRDLQRGVFASKELKKGMELSSEDFFLSIPPEKGQLLANDLSKFVNFTLNDNIPKNAPIMVDNTTQKFHGDTLVKIKNEVNSILKESAVVVPKETPMEISHHYGLDNFYEFGITMFTVVNREYCKKLIVVLPGQKHPEQFHKQKEETFHILYGDLELILDDEAHTMVAGDVITVMPTVRHIFESKNGCVIEEISSTHIKDDSFYTDPEISKNKDRKTFLKSWLDFPF